MVNDKFDDRRIAMTIVYMAFAVLFLVVAVNHPEGALACSFFCTAAVSVAIIRMGRLELGYYSFGALMAHIILFISGMLLGLSLRSVTWVGFMYSWAFLFIGLPFVLIWRAFQSKPVAESEYETGY